MSFFAPITNSLVAEQATAAFRLESERTMVTPAAEAGGDEALKKDNDDGRRQKPVPPPRRRVRTNQPVVNGCLVEARRLAGWQLLQGSAVGRRFKRSHSLRDRRQVEQRRQLTPARSMDGLTFCPAAAILVMCAQQTCSQGAKLPEINYCKQLKQCISDHRAALTPARPRRIWLAC